MKISSANKKFCATIFTNLSKAFDCLCHNLLIAKLNAFGIDQNALKFIHDYLSDRSQKTKVTSSFSAYLGIIYGVPQGFILRPLLLNINLCNLFFEIIVLTLQIWLMIPLLMKSVIISKKGFNGSVSTTWKQIILILYVICLFLFTNMFQ